MNNVSKAGPTISVQIGYAEALAYSRFLPKVRLVDYEDKAQDVDEAHDMLDAGEKIFKALKGAGFK